MMTEGNARYGRTAKTLHWSIALLVAAQFFVGFIMPDINRKTEVEFWIGLHLSLGALIVLAMIFRMAWRICNPVPQLHSLPRWQQLASHGTHAMLYLLLAVAPVLGWANASSRGWDVGLFGFVGLPRLTAEGSGIGGAMGDVHMVLAYALLGFITLHVLAALYHHVILRDHVLRQMLPKLRPARNARRLA